MEALVLEIQQLRSEYTALQQDLAEQLNKRDAIIEQLRLNITELTNRTKDQKNYDQRRIHNAQLLKGKEPTEFKEKDSYAAWAESLKADLYPTLPELRKFFDFAEHRHINSEDPTGWICTQFFLYKKIDFSG